MLVGRPRNATLKKQGRGSGGEGRYGDCHMRKIRRDGNPITNLPDIIVLLLNRW